VLHDWATDFACRRFALALANPVMRQYTPTALTMPSLTVLVTASLHVLPQRLHLSAESSGTFWPKLALGSVSKQEEALLLLANDLLGISAARSSAIAARVPIRHSL